MQAFGEAATPSPNGSGGSALRARQGADVHRIATTHGAGFKMALRQAIEPAGIIISKALQKRRARRDKRLQLAALRSLDRRTLKDIAIDRSEIMSVVFTDREGRRR